MRSRHNVNDSRVLEFGHDMVTEFVTMCGQDKTGNHHASALDDILITKTEVLLLLFTLTEGSR